MFEHRVYLHPQRGAHHPQLHHRASIESGGQPSVAIAEPGCGDSLDPQAHHRPPGPGGTSIWAPAFTISMLLHRCRGLKRGYPGLVPSLLQRL